VYSTVVVPKEPAGSDKTGQVYMLPVPVAFLMLEIFSSKIFVLYVNKNNELLFQKQLWR
jgi:hypothetical protein